MYVVVIDLDARKAQSGETIFRLKQALAEHLILIFKQQSLDDLQYLTFSSYFGPIFKLSADHPVLATQSDTAPPRCRDCFQYCRSRRLYEA